MDLTVYLVKGKRPLYVARWRDPVTGRWRQESTGHRRLPEARKVATRIEKQLREGTYRRGATPWADFVGLYLDELRTNDRSASVADREATLRKVKQLIDPGTLQVFATAEQLMRFKRLLGKARRGKRDDSPTLSRATISKHMRNVRAALRWAKRKQLLDFVPDFDPISTAEAAARAVTGEELERMVAAVPVVIPEAQVEAYRFLLLGIWETGLRISEALALRWDDGAVALDWNGGRPRICFDSSQKNRTAQVVPLTPSATALLSTVPEEIRDRRGFVFDGLGRARRREGVGKKITAIGEAARVSTAPGRWAGAHDIRRGFGARWAVKVQPAALMTMMRHSAIATTMTFYAGDNSTQVEAMLWEGHQGPKADHHCDESCDASPKSGRHRQAEESKK